MRDFDLLFVIRKFNLITVFSKMSTLDAHFKDNTGMGSLILERHVIEVTVIPKLIEKNIKHF